MPLDNLHLLDDVSRSVEKAHMHGLSTSMSNIKPISVEVPSFDGIEGTLFDVVTGPLFDGIVDDLQQIDCHPRISTDGQHQKENRASLLSAGVMDRGVCNENGFISYTCALCTNTVSAL